jgi:hypothetical protein
MTDLNDLIVDLYDEHVHDHPSGVKVAEAKAAILVAVADLVRARERDVMAEAELAMNAAINPERRRRSSSLKQNLEHLLAGFTEDGSYLDPLMAQAYSLGSEAGVDKALRNWTPDDFADLIVTRYRVAADSTTAAAEFDRTAQRVADRIRATGGGTVGDVDWGTP